MKNKYLYIETFGCQMNVHDSEQMAALLAQSGYKVTDNLKLADLILLNTCSIREKATQKVYSELGRLGKVKEQNPDLIIGVGGCLAQHLGAKFHKRVRHLDFVFGTHNIHRLPEMIASVKKKREKILMQIILLIIFRQKLDQSLMKYIYLIQVITTCQKKTLKN